MNYLFIDFEYNSSNEQYLNLVCASMSLTDKKFEVIEDKDIWFYEEHFSFIEFDHYLKYIKEKHGDFVVLCWSANAEGRAFLGAEQNPRDFVWIDLQAEYKMLLNHCHEFMYGDQLIDGKYRKTIPPREKFELTEEEQKKAHANKPQSNLVAAVFKLLDVRIDSEHKDKMRDIIIRNDYNEIMENAQEILEYCRSDIKYLPLMFEKILEIYSKFNNNALKNNKITKEEMFWRGRSVVNTAIIENNGYPVNFVWAKNFTENVPKMQLALAKEINSQFSEENAVFNIKDINIRNEEREIIGTKTVATRRIKYWKEWIAENCDTNKWLRTDKDGLSTGLDSWIRYFNPPRHTFEKGNFPHQVVRYLKFNKNLNGFLPAKKGKAKFIDFFGDDGRVRGFLNSYGSQSARWQPKAVSFLYLKSAVMRSMCTSEPGDFICAIDYSQQEFLISALLSKDENMINAYKTGDVYLHTAKLAGAVPQDGTRKEYPEERDIYKAVTLAISYMMSKYGLADTLTQSLKREVDTEEAQEFIDNFYEAYSDFGEFMDEQVVSKYELQNYLKLIDGWVLFGDNPNFRSYGNFSIQGMGSCILRRAIDMCIEEGLKVIFPLHDALYVEAPIEERDETIQKFDSIMKRAFGYYFPNREEVENIIRTDVNIWGPDCKNETLTVGDIEVKSQDIYIDERSEKDFEFFKEYMMGNNAQVMTND